MTPADLKTHRFLAGMARDPYFPRHLVAQGAAILRQLAAELSANPPADQDALFALTHAAVEQFNALQEDFLAEGSELETVARECIAEDIDTILRAHGHQVDLEAAIANRDW